MLLRAVGVAFLVAAVLHPSPPAANQASGTVTTSTLGAIKITSAVGYRVRDQRDARRVQTEVLLTDVPVDAAPMAAALDPHMAAINLEGLRGRNYVLLWVSADGSVSMNATFSKTMTQFMDNTTGGLTAAFTTYTPSRLDGRVFSRAPIKTMDGTTYTVDLRFAVDVPPTPAAQPLGPGGGDPGKALVAFVDAAKKKNWDAVKAGSSPQALAMFDKSYNTPAENASSAADLLKAWLPIDKMTITRGEVRGEAAILDVEGELFRGQLGLSLVRMIRNGPTWLFDQAARVGMVRPEGRSPLARRP
jgi:hypothetical protein